MARIQKSLRLSRQAVDNVNAIAVKEDRSFNYICNKLFEDLPKVAKGQEPRARKTPVFKKTLWPAGFICDSYIQQAAFKYWNSKGRTDLSVFDEFEKFKAYSISNGKKYVNWSSAWTTWYSNAVSFNKAPTGGHYGQHKPNSSERLQKQAESLFGTSEQRATDSSTLVETR